MRELLIIIIYFVNETRSGFVGLEAIPERIELAYSNSKYVENITVTVRKYNRKGSYVVNMAGDVKQTWANNVSVDVVMYEYLHNEYKRSFVEMHYKLCDLINKDEFIGSAIRLRGITCPFHQGRNGITNATMKFPKFPYVFPFQRCKAEVILKTEPAHEVMAKGNLYLTIKQSN